MVENAARADWAGVGVRLPRRLLGPAHAAAGGPARAARRRCGAPGGERWRLVGAHDGAQAAARELEAWAGRAGVDWP